MVENPYVVKVDDSIDVAAQSMGRHRVRHLPVVNGKRVVGIISERDVDVGRAVSACHPSGRRLLVREICSLSPYVVKPDTALSAVARKMGKDKIEAAIVVENEVPIGIFTTSDACKILGELFDAPRSEGGLFSKLFG